MGKLALQLHASSHFAVETLGRLRLNWFWDKTTGLSQLRQMQMQTTSSQQKERKTNKQIKTKPNKPPTTKQKQREHSFFKLE